MSLHILSFAIRHPICLSKCVRNYRQFQKHALAPTLGAIVLFTAGKYRSETRGCARQLTWQLAENNPAREESNHVIMHTHVAWVKIKPYSSLAASLLSCLSPSQDMAAVQPGSQEKRCHGFHGRSQIRGRLETRSEVAPPLPQLSLSFPTDHKLCTDAGGLEFCWMGASVLTEAPLHPA